MEWIFLAVVALLGLGLALLGGFVFLRWLARLYAAPRRPAHPAADAARPEVGQPAPETENRPTVETTVPAAAPSRRENCPDQETRALLRTPLARFSIVGFIAVVLLLPLMLVKDLTDERASLYRSVVRDISKAWGGEQQITGPILLIPYSERQITSRTVRNEDPKASGGEEYRVIKESRLVPGYFVLLPARAAFTCNLDPQERQRGIYRSLVYTARLRMAGHFTLPPLESLKRIAPDLESVDFQRAFAVVGLSWPSALRTVGPFAWNRAELAAEPGTQPFTALKEGFRIPVPLSPDVKQYDFSQELVFNGSSGISFTPVGGVTAISLMSPWPHPSFRGDILPVTREVSATGFTAGWDIPSLARSYPNLGTLKTWPDRFTSFAAGVALYESASHYHLIERSVKYGILFIGLTFLAFIIFELSLNARLHPVQYGLVGLAMVVFYLVLLSLSEHFTFLPSYAAASACTVLMIALYAGAALRSIRQGFSVGLLLTALYSLLYAILQMEDYALLMGTALVLVMLGVLMVVSRNLAFERI